MTNDWLIETAEARVEAETAGAVAMASGKVAQPGKTTCDDCGSIIPEARRAAAPFAVRCIDCQTEADRRDG